MKIAGIEVYEKRDLEGVSTVELLGFFNTHSPLQTKRFPDRASGIRRVWDLILDLAVAKRAQNRQDAREEALTSQEITPLDESSAVIPTPQDIGLVLEVGAPILAADFSAPEPTPAPKRITRTRKTEGNRKKGSGFSFRMAPKRVQLLPRPGSKREVALRLVSQADGALFSEIAEKCGWIQKDAYEGLRLLNVHSGFGLWHERVGDDDYRIFKVEQDEFSRRVQEEVGKP